MRTRKDYINTIHNKQVMDLINKGERFPFLCNSIIDDNNLYMNGSRNYSLHLFGVLPCGSKVCVTLTDVPVYFYVKHDIKTLKNIMSKYENDDNYTEPEYEEIKKYPFRGFSIEPHTYTKLSFKSTWDRNKYMALFKEVTNHQEDITAEDDSNYINLIIRTYGFLSSGWNSIDEYTRMEQPFRNLQNCDYYFKTSINNIRPEKDPAKNFPMLDKNVFLFEKLMLMSWDIETIIDPKETIHKAIKNANAYNVFMICMTFSWQYTDDPFRKICITEKPVSNLGDLEGEVDIFVIPDEKDRIIKFAEIIRDMRPDILVAFNGSNFDWPAIVNKAINYEMLSTIHNTYSCYKSNNDVANLKKYVYQRKKFKINAGKYHYSEIVANVPGFVDTDCAPVFLKLYSNAEIPKMAALNYFLQANKIELKDDLDYKTMKEYYVTNDTEKWGIIAHYCVKDCYGPMRLYKKRNIIAEKREFANLAFVEHKAAYYNADGMKVVNLMGYIANLRNIAFSNRRKSSDDFDEKKDRKKKKEDDEKEKIKYEGAHVFESQLGLNRKRPIAGNDFGSLYPSIINAYNISTDMIVTDEEYANELIAAGYRLEKFENMAYWKKKDPETKWYNTAWFVQHNNVDDETNEIVKYYDQYIDGVKTKSITHVKSHDKLFENVTEFDVSHIEQLKFDINNMGNNKIPNVKYQPVYGRKRLKNERFGLQAIACRTLLDMRIPLKARAKELYDKLEVMKKNGQTETEEYYATSQEYSIVMAKQLAVKIMNNTIYGQMGSETSPLYMLHVAQAVTSKGRELLKLIGAYLESLKFRIIYGDTDSVYPEPPDEFFKYVDEKYKDVVNLPVGIIKDKEIEKRRVEYWDVMVKMSMLNTQFKLLQINELLVAYTNSLHLVVAYEEVGMPTLWCGKKKYAMVEHVKNTNFYPQRENIFLRGLEMKKQGQNRISIDLGFELLERVFHPGHNMDVYETAIELIKEYKKRNWKTEDFVIYKTYRADKDNVNMNNFVANIKRMKEHYSQLPDKRSEKLAELYQVPEDQDKVAYVIVKTTGGIDKSGRQIKLNKSDKMCPVLVYSYLKEIGEPLEIDYKEYLKNALGNIARMCSYKFMPITKKEHPDMKGKALDALNFNYTKKKLLEILEEDDIDKSQVRELYENAYKTTHDFIEKHDELQYLKPINLLKPSAIKKDIFNLLGIRDKKLQNFDDVIEHIGRDYEVILKNLIAINLKTIKSNSTDIMKKFKSLKEDEVDIDEISNRYKTSLTNLKNYIDEEFTDYAEITSELSSIANSIATERRKVNPLFNGEVNQVYYKFILTFNGNIEKILELDKKCDDIKTILNEVIESKLLLMLYERKKKQS